MNKGITVNELYLACKEQIEKGNGDKYIISPTDDEMNGVHTLYCTFVDDESVLTDALALEHDNHTVDEVVLLG